MHNLGKLTAQHADALTRATAEARLAEEIQRRRDAEAERAEREQADGATAQAITRMDDLERELAELRAATEAEVRSTRASAAADIQQARETAGVGLARPITQCPPPGSGVEEQRNSH